MKNVLLIGTPNSGKTALFNALTGSHRKVANYSGITVDTGFAPLLSNQDIKLVDLPGFFSITPSSLDEMVTLLTLVGKNPQIESFEEILLVIDLARIDSSIAMAMSLKEKFGDSLKLVFNKSDIENAKNYDLDKMAKSLGLESIAFSSFKDKPTKLSQFIENRIQNKALIPLEPFEIPRSALKLTPLQIELTQNDFFIITESSSNSVKKISQFQRKARDFNAKHAIGDNKDQIQRTNQIDRVVLHPLFGGLIFFSIFYFIFHSLYTFSGPLMDTIDQGVGTLGSYVGNLIPAGEFNSFIVDGIIGGVGGIIIFLPQIVILFFLLSLLEQSGYIGRASIITDRLMSFFGLNGKAFLPFMSGFACSIPAIMATRTMADRRERMATLMVIPLITCSARLPVYVLLIGTFIPDKIILGFLNLQALSFFFLYFLGSITALIIAKIFRLTFFKGQSTSFVMELPLYQSPSLKIAIRSMKHKGKIFLKKAGTIILGLSIFIWILSTYPKTHPSLLTGKTEAQVASISLENSTIGKIGKFIEPAIKPLGYNWKMGIGILVAFGARELFVSTLGTIYSLEDVDENSHSLRQRLQTEIDPITGKPVFNFAVAWSLLIFFAYACQCISTLAIVRRETESYLHVASMFIYMGILAYGGAFITYRMLV